MYRQKRSDTTVGTIQDTYGMDLHCRCDTKLGNLLAERGFDSLSQLRKAYCCGATELARRRKVFLSFHAEDLRQVHGLRLMFRNPRLDLDIYDNGLRTAINSERGTYIRSVIRERIRKSAVVLCLIGNGTAWREWVDWELRTAVDLHKGVCGVRLKDSRGRTPPALADLGVPVLRWGTSAIVAAVEYAAARRS
jgi:hypothetical protein